MSYVHEYLIRSAPDLEQARHIARARAKRDGYLVKEVISAVQTSQGASVMLLVEDPIWTDFFSPEA